MKTLFKTNLLLIAVMAFVVSLASCQDSKWNTNIDSTYKKALKSKKDVILLFTADWTDENSNVLEEIFCKKEFTKKYSKKYLFANVTLLQQDFITMELGENATQEQIDAAQKLQAEYEKKNEMVQNYSVKNFPDLFIVSGEGYVLSHVEFDQEKWTEELVDEKISQAEKESEELKNLLLEIRSTKGVEKAKAIDKFVNTSPKQYNTCLKDLILEYSSLDPENQTGLLGSYELGAAYYISFGAITAGEDPSVAFIDAINANHMTKLQQQEAYYMASYSLANSQIPDYERIYEYLQKAYDIDPQSEYAPEISTALESIKKYNEAVENVTKEAETEQ